MQLIILDRDGVINEDSDAFIKSPAEWKPIRGSLEAIARLHRAGWRVVIATNQSGIARKLFDLDMLSRIHETMHRQVAESGGLIDAVFFCPWPKFQCNNKNTGRKSEISYKFLPTDDPKTLQPNITLAKEILGWEPVIPLEEGLGKTIDYFRTVVLTGDAS